MTASRAGDTAVTTTNWEAATREPDLFESAIRFGRRPERALIESTALALSH
jgi:hypothetical protein